MQKWLGKPKPSKKMMKPKPSFHLEAKATKMWLSLASSFGEARALPERS